MNNFTVIKPLFSWLTGWKSVEVVPRLVQDYMSGNLLLDEFVTHRLTLDQVNQAFDHMITWKRSFFASINEHNGFVL